MHAMDLMRLRCVLDVVDGPSRRVGQAGVLIGRQGDCDLVATDPSASRRHALVRFAGDGIEIVPLGRASVDVNGVAVDKPRALGDGDVLAVPGLTLRVSITVPRPERAGLAGFVLERRRGGRFGVPHTPFHVGGGDHDDLIIKSWPPRMLVFHVAQGELFVEASRDGATRNGAPIGALDPVAVDDCIACRGEDLVVRAADANVTTRVTGRLPTRVEVEMLPRGGRVAFTIGAEVRPVFLADRRLDLIVALMRTPNEFVSDDALGAVVWPRKPGFSRSEINMLISRCRRDLVEAGLAGPRLIERAPGGRGTRLAVAPNAQIVFMG